MLEDPECKGLQGKHSRLSGNPLASISNDMAPVTLGHASVVQQTCGRFWDTDTHTSTAAKALYPYISAVYRISCGMVMREFFFSRGGRVDEQIAKTQTGVREDGVRAIDRNSGPRPFAIVGERPLRGDERVLCNPTTGRGVDVLKGRGGGCWVPRCPVRDLAFGSVVH